MRISEAKECIKELYLNTDSVTALISERGIGKTSAYQQCAKELNIGYIDLYGAALEGPDFMGLPDKDRELGITRYFAPQFLPTKQAVEQGMYPDKGILVIEEINRVPSDTISVLYPLLLEKKINGHQLAEGWAIGVTMNPDTMNYLVNALDDAMLDRFIAIEVQANLEDYIAYSKQNNGNQEVLDFLKDCPDMLLIVKKASESSALSKAPTPRGWTKVQELLNNCTLDLLLMKELVAGIVGLEASSAFYGYLENRNRKIPSSKSILENYGEVKPLVVELVENNEISILHHLIPKVVEGIEATDIHRDNVEKFVEDLPKELQIVFYKRVGQSRGELLTHLSEDSEVFDSISESLMDIMML